MELTFNQLKCKEVVNLTDGKRLGRICDMIFDSDGSRVFGFVVPCTRKLFKPNQDLFIPLCDVVKFGDDVILVKVTDASIIEKNDKKKQEHQEDFII